MEERPLSPDNPMIYWRWLRDELRKLPAWLVDFLPAHWSHAIFVCAVLSLLIAPFLTWAAPPEVTPIQQGGSMLDLMDRLSGVNPFYAQFGNSPSAGVWNWSLIVFFPKLLTFLGGWLLLNLLIRPCSGVDRWVWRFSVGMPALGIVALIARLSFIRPWWIRQPLAGSAFEEPLGFREWLPILIGLGTGFYVAVAGLMLAMFTFWYVHRNPNLLPISFRNRKPGSGEPDGPVGLAIRRFAFFVTGAMGVVLLVARTGFAGVGLVEQTRTNVRIIIWLQAISVLEVFLIPLVIALWVMHSNRWGEIRAWLRFSRPRFYLPAALIPVALFWAMVFFEVSARYLYVSWAGFEQSPDFWDFSLNPTWSAWFLFYFLDVLLTEMAWRGFLQSRMIRLFGVRRGIFLVALLFAIVGTFSTGPFDAGPVQAMSELMYHFAFQFGFASLVGWIVLRAGSVLPAVLMQGTSILHSSSLYLAYSPRLGIFPEVVHVLLLALIGYLLFKFWPPTKDEIEVSLKPVVG